MKSCSSTGWAKKKAWATELAGLQCPLIVYDVSWYGRRWQIVSDEKQAANLVGAFQYADAHWPWLGGPVYLQLRFQSEPGPAAANRCGITGSSIGLPTQRWLMCPKIPLPFPAKLKTDVSQSDIPDRSDRPAARLYRSFHR